MSVQCHTGVRGINVTCRDFQCHKIFRGSQELLPGVFLKISGAWQWSSCAAMVPGGLSWPLLCLFYHLLSQLPAMLVVHFIFQIALISEECFLFQTSPFLCDKETYFFFFLLTRLCSLHSLEGNFTNSPLVCWQHNYHLTWQLFSWILNIQNTSKGTGGIQWFCCLLLRSVELFWKGKGFLQSQGRHSMGCRWQLSDEKGFGKYQI